MCYRFCTCTTITVFVVVVFVEFSIAENMNLFAIICSVLFIAILIIALIIVLSMKRQSAKYYTHEDKLGMINCILRICYIDFARVLCVHVTRHGLFAQSITFNFMLCDKYCQFCRWPVREKSGLAVNQRK